MPWQFDYTSEFLEKIKSLPHKYQRAQILNLLETIKKCSSPKDMGGAYLKTWTYFFGNKSMIQCDINEEKQIAIFTNIVI